MTNLIIFLVPPYITSEQYWQICYRSMLCQLLLHSCLVYLKNSVVNEILFCCAICNCQVGLEEKNNKTIWIRWMMSNVGCELSHKPVNSPSLIQLLNQTVASMTFAIVLLSCARCDKSFTEKVQCFEFLATKCMTSETGGRRCNAAPRGS